MTWDRLHRRAEVVRAVAAQADRRRDGVLPTDLAGIQAAFHDDTDLVLALQLRWHTRLSGVVERTLAEDPFRPDAAVVTAWRRTAASMPGLRAILDAQRRDPATPDVAEALRRADRKDWTLLAAMAGRAGASDPAAPALGRRLEEQARAGHDAHLAA